MGVPWEVVVMFVCTVRAADVDTGAAWLLAATAAPTADAAVGWLTARATALAHALQAPDPAARGTRADPALILRVWAGHTPVLEAQRALLAAGQPVSLTVPVADSLAGRRCAVVYRLAARPRRRLHHTPPPPERTRP